MPYKYLDEVSYADVAFEASGATLAEMFESAGLAVTNSMIRDVNQVKARIKKMIKMEASTLEMLLFNFLQDFVFWKDKDLLLFSKVKVRITEPKGNKKHYSLSAILSGEKMTKKHTSSLVVDVKAVTWHLFKVGHIGKEWKCHVVLDV